MCMGISSVSATRAQPTQKVEIRLHVCPARQVGKHVLPLHYALQATRGLEPLWCSCCGESTTVDAAHQAACIAGEPEHA